MEDAADDLAVFEHVEVGVAPTRRIAALEDQRGHHGAGGGGGGLGGRGAGGFSFAALIAHGPRASIPASQRAAGAVSRTRQGFGARCSESFQPLPWSVLLAWLA